VFFSSLFFDKGAIKSIRIRIKDDFLENNVVHLYFLQQADSSTIKAIFKYRRVFYVSSSFFQHHNVLFLSHFKLFLSS